MFVFKRKGAVAAVAAVPLVVAHLAVLAAFVSTTWQWLGAVAIAVVMLVVIAHVAPAYLRRWLGRGDRKPA